MNPSLPEVFHWLLLPVEQSSSYFAWRSRSLTIEPLLTSQSLLLTLKTRQMCPNSCSSRAPNAGSRHCDRINDPFSLVFPSVSTQTSKSSFSQIWTPDQQNQHITWEHLRNEKFQQLSQTCLSQVLWRWGSAIRVLTRLPSNSGVCSSLRTLARSPIRPAASFLAPTPNSDFRESPWDPHCVPLLDHRSPWANKT